MEQGLPAREASYLLPARAQPSRARCSDEVVVIKAGNKKLIREYRIHPRLIWVRVRVSV